ncbi:SPOR domain-containing protein [Geomesophilobacter sediminis]|uniref:SPOR domain-containing protein n=1 Tax=Geomesophilobacter sediminis TaxID=2798584 RepID=A0A8J7SAY6_9BACT|nr:SPOR domain-containing protein [Geomesophilobacter sediminis]MBJ6727521.1 SPOR domain-containing protein [Geomesophilobacter sediminis]
MVMDYRDKKPIQNNTEKRTVAKNKARREPIGLIALVSVIALLTSFGAGVLTGWLIFKGRKPAAPVAAAAPAAKKDELPQPSAKAGPAGAEPLTFYHTLPQGGKAALGSGMNPKKDDKKSNAVTTVPVAAPAPADAAGGAAGAPSAAGAAGAAKEGGTRYVVQTASYRDKKEAEAAREKLSGKGLAAYVVESNTPEKGLWFRVRIGKHLSREEAKGLAGNAGQGAIVVAE